MKQERYLGGAGEDWIDECAKTLTEEEFRGAMKFTIGKYMRRMGKKDPVEQEQAKINDYIERWASYEIGETGLDRKFCKDIIDAEVQYLMNQNELQEG